MPKTGYKDILPDDPSLVLKGDGTWGAGGAGEPIPGPQGPAGADGRDGYTPIKGVDYFDGAAGRDGADGADSTVPGPAGADSTVPGPPGPAGADSTVPGPKGDKGDKGDQGNPSTVPGPAGTDGEDGHSPVVAFGTGGDADRLAIDGTPTGPHLTGSQGTPGVGEQGIQGIQGPPGTAPEPVYALLSNGATAMAFGTNDSGFKSVGTLATGTVTARVFVVHFTSDGTNLYESGRTAAMAA